MPQFLKEIKCIFFFSLKLGERHEERCSIPEKKWSKMKINWNGEETRKSEENHDRLKGHEKILKRKKEKKS